MAKSPEEISSFLSGKDEAKLSTMLMESAVAFIEQGQPAVGASFALAAATYAQAAQLKRISDSMQILAASSRITGTTRPGGEFFPMATPRTGG